MHIHSAVELKMRDFSTMEMVFSTDATRDKVLSAIIVNSAFRLTTLTPQSFAADNPQGLTSKWLQGRLSNFAYLMAINKYAGRSVYDVSRHPFLPWLVMNMELENIVLHDANFFRDLSKPIAYMLDNERAAQLDHKMKCMERDKDPHAHNLPVFVSTPHSTQQYLGGVQGGSTPLREWSLPKHLRQLQTQTAVMSECVPEYYYLPQAFTTLAEVEFPRYTRPASPAAFVYLQRLMLESRHVSSMLHRWVDLFFGVTSRGKSAKEAKNVYPGAIYPEKAAKMMAEKGAAGLSSYREVWEGGQLPAQVFWGPHVAKNIGLIDQLRPRCYSSPAFKPYVVSFKLTEAETNRPIRGCYVQFVSDRIVISTNTGIAWLKTSVSRSPKDLKVEKVSCSILERTEINKLLGRDH